MDTLSWSSGRDGAFSVKSYYNLLKKKIFGGKQVFPCYLERESTNDSFIMQRILGT